MLLTKGKWILIGVLIVLLGGTLTYFGWTKQKSEPVKSQSEQTETKALREVVIPSSLDIGDVVEAIAQFLPYLPPWGESITQEDPFWATHFGILYPHRGFIKGFGTSWHGIVWTKKDGTKVEPPDDPYGFMLGLVVLKYEKPEFAREDYDRVSISQKFRESILEGVKLKTKIGLPSVEWDRLKTYVKFKQEQCQQYLLRSNNFIIYAYGLREVAEDFMIRVIDQYAVE